MRLPVHERYREDPQFQMLVDVVRGWLSQNPETTPTELREAVMLAASMHEQVHIRPLLISREEASIHSPVLLISREEASIHSPVYGEWSREVWFDPREEQP